MKKKLIIVGAGISGIYTAYLLKDKYDITIIEARDRVGGRILTINEFDLGASWIWKHQKNISFQQHWKHQQIKDLECCEYCTATREISYARPIGYNPHR